MHLLASSYLHTISPFAWEFPPSWSALPLVPDGIRWYGLSYIAGFIVGWLLLGRLSRRGRTQLPLIDGKAGPAVGDFLTHLIFGVLVGGRLGHVLFYEPSLLWHFQAEIPFWGALQIDRGGMSSHGGMIGVAVACLAYARSRGIDRWHVFDLAAFICPPGLMSGRIANFINAELWGNPLPRQEDPPWWSIRYPGELILQEPPFNVARLDDVRLELTQTLSLDPTVHNVRFLHDVHDAMLQGNQTIITLAESALTAHYPSQLLQAFTEGPVLLALLLIVWLKPRRPGIVAAWFLIGYGCLRILTEILRDTSADMERFLGVITRGQALSGVMVLVGVAMLAHCRRRAVGLTGGLVRKSL
jgi:phosphatidylglycerol---prolipoprotein diacylglyceryl transferase